MAESASEGELALRYTEHKCKPLTDLHIAYSNIQTWHIARAITTCLENNGQRNENKWQICNRTPIE